MDETRDEGVLEARAFLEECLEGSPGELLRQMPGRETYGVEGPGGVKLVLKRYDSSWGWQSPASREYAALEALAQLGLRVPRPVAYLERGRRSVLAMDRIESSSTLREALSTTPPEEVEEFIRRLLGLVTAFHGHGWHHRDLYLHHILIDARGELVLIDVGRARRPHWVRRRWFAKDLAALLLWAPARVSELSQLRFLSRYMDEMGILGRRERRRFAVDILRRRGRMAGHRPRHGEVGEWEPPQ